MKLIKYPLNTLNQYARSTITEMGNINHVKIIDMGIYHKLNNLVKRLYQTLQFFYALLNESDKALKNCR
jgi:hypothetical protein